MSAFILAIDVGGTKTLIGAFDLEGKALGEWVQPTRGRASDDVVGVAMFAQQCEVALRATSSHLGRLEAIALGFPEYVSAGGALTSHDVLTWQQQPLDLMTTTFSVPVVVDSDVRLGALSEAIFGAGLGGESFFYVSLGTGISSTFVADSRVWLGARGEAIGIGERLIAVPNFPTLESYASGAAIESRFISEGGEALPAVEIASRAAVGDKVAEDVLVSAGQVLGDVLSDLTHLLDPHSIVLGGGIGATGNAVTNSARRRYESLVARRVGAAPIRHAHFRHRSGLLGSAIAAWRTLGIEPSSDSLTALATLTEAPIHD